VNLDPAAYAAADLPPDKSALIVFYCSNPWCRKAPNAGRRAAGLGYTNVAGIQGWGRAGCRWRAGGSRSAAPALRAPPSFGRQSAAGGIPKQAFAHPNPLDLCDLGKLHPPALRMYCRKLRLFARPFEVYARSFDV
jgi:hypothetical protein